MSASNQFEQAVAPSSRFRGLSRSVLRSSITYIVMGLAVWLLDTFIGPPDVFFPILFVLPVTLAAWFSGRGVAFALAVILPIGRAWIEGVYEASVQIPYAVINAAIAMSVLLLIAYFVSRSSQQNQQLKLRVKQLQSILPVCMGCQRIRDEHDYWSKLDEYVTKHTESVVSHGLCPECAQRLYGDVPAQSSR